MSISRSSAHEISSPGPQFLEDKGYTPGWRPLNSMDRQRSSLAGEFLQTLPSTVYPGSDPSKSMQPSAKRPESRDLGSWLMSPERPGRQSSMVASGYQPSYNTSQGVGDYGPEQIVSGSSRYPYYPGQTDSSMWSHPSPSGHSRTLSYLSQEDHPDFHLQGPLKRSTVTVAGPQGDEGRSKRYRGGRDEFDGSVQYLQKPPKGLGDPHEQDLPPLPVHLDDSDQEEILTQVNRRLSQCAFDFIALYRFPIPIEPNKPAVQGAQDKAWTEWAYLLKRLAIKRKIPSHAIFRGQIKELTTILDNSLEMRHTTKPQPRSLKDDRTVLQFISAGIQVGKILKDASTMGDLDRLYQRTEKLIQERKGPSQSSR